jgi:hypothetical protein
MDTSDLKSAIRVAQSACRTAEKEAVYAQRRLAEDSDEVDAASCAESAVSQALAYLDAALRYCELEEF